MTRTVLPQPPAASHAPQKGLPAISVQSVHTQLADGREAQRDMHGRGARVIRAREHVHKAHGEA